MTRGDVWWADLEPRSGAEQHGRRPVVVLSHQGFLDVAAWRSVIVIPISTSRAQARRGPSVVSLTDAVRGLSPESVALCHQITTLDRSKLERKVGSLSDEALRRVEAGLKAATGLS